MSMICLHITIKLSYSKLILKIQSNTETLGTKETSNAEKFWVGFKIFQCFFSVVSV